MDYSLVQALKYAATDLPFGRLLNRLVSKQATLSEAPAEGHYYWLQELRKIDPQASGDSVGHLHSVAKVLAGVADHSSLPASLQSDNSPLGRFLKAKLQPPKPVPTTDSPLEPLSLSQEPPDSPKALLPEAAPQLPIGKRPVTPTKPTKSPASKPPVSLAEAIRNRPLAKD